MSDSVYQALLSSHALIEFDVNGHVLYANQNYLDLMGYEKDEVIGKHHSFFMPHNSANEVLYEEMWTRLVAGGSQTGEFNKLTKSGNVIWFQGSYTPVKNENGDIIRILKLAVDITEKKQLAENLEKKNQELLAAAAKARAATDAKSVFLANMSHEIRTPLNSIIGITDTLAETDLDAQQSSFVEILQRANHQLITIINDVLDLTKVEAGEIQLNLLPFSLHKVIDDVMAVLSFRAKEKGLLMRVTVETSVDSYYLGDSDRLRQVLINLLNNAIKFTDSGSITMKISKNHTAKPGNLLFCISDTGIGISRHKFKDIFKPFTQADSTTTRRYGGTGLGLSITQKIVELMNGQIWLDSERNVGSQFYFTATMPITTERSFLVHNPLQGQKHLRDIKNLIATSRLRILVVDDVDDNRNLFGIYLQKTAHDITYAENGFDALKMVEATAYDIIFMDVQMPGIDGYEATRRIRALEKFLERSPSRIFACTANAFSEDVQKSLKAGCDMHLSKPVRKDTMIKAINSLFISQEATY